MADRILKDRSKVVSYTSIFYICTRICAKIDARERERERGGRAALEGAGSKSSLVLSFLLLSIFLLLTHGLLLLFAAFDSRCSWFDLVTYIHL